MTLKLLFQVLLKFQFWHAGWSGLRFALHTLCFELEDRGIVDERLVAFLFVWAGFNQAFVFRILSYQIVKFVSIKLLTVKAIRVFLFFIGFCCVHNYSACSSFTWHILSVSHHQSFLFFSTANYFSNETHFVGGWVKFF